jgi:hypothetical protein
MERKQFTKTQIRIWTAAYMITPVVTYAADQIMTRCWRRKATKEIAELNELFSLPSYEGEKA